ncbi:MAG: HupE/UreJ family protein, partial [Microbacteriaceae bacterium]|nr:HupE/UreJ family protein [Burkholderiaceae bacterium]
SLLALLLFWGSAQAWAHKGSDAYLDVQSTEGAGLGFTLAVAIKDLDVVVPLDADADGKVTWGEIKAATPAVQALLQANAVLDGAPPAPGAPGCGLQWKFAGLERRSDGGYMRLAAEGVCAGARLFRYSLFKDQDATHRLIVTGRIDGRDVLSTLSPVSHEPLRLRVGSGALAGGAGSAQGSASAQGADSSTAHAGLVALWVYLRMGVHHLLEGYDHLAFLLALVLPLRLPIRLPVPRLVSQPMRSMMPAAAGAGGGSTAFTLRSVPLHDAMAPGGASVWLTLLRTITAFTIGHSITLILATLGWTQASPVWVEPTIALSMGVTALLNLHPVRHVRTDVLALLFGMVHGLGFAGLLTEAAAPSGLLPWALAGFNIGVECGQLLAVASWVLLSQLLLRRPWYGSVVVRGGSWALALLSAFWFWQRVA